MASSLMDCTPQQPNQLAEGLGEPPYRSDGETVPDRFERSAQWNPKTICPAGTELSPFMRYEMSQAERAVSSFTHYFARTCNSVAPEARESGADRRLASSSDSGSPGYSITPHGPFIRWHQNGRVMIEGRYSNGTIQGDWKQYRPDGTPVVSSEGIMLTAPLDE